MAHPDDDLLGVPDVADLLGMDESYVRRALRSERLPAHKLNGRAWAIRRGDAIAWAATLHRRAPRKPRTPSAG
jgi:excisionase family DNA binding protein